MTDAQNRLTLPATLHFFNIDLFLYKAEQSLKMFMWREESRGCKGLNIQVSRWWLEAYLSDEADRGLPDIEIYLWGFQSSIVLPRFNQHRLAFTVGWALYSNEDR